MRVFVDECVLGMCVACVLRCVVCVLRGGVYCGCVLRGGMYCGCV